MYPSPHVTHRNSQHLSLLAWLPLRTFFIRQDSVLQVRLSWISQVAGGML